MRVKKDQINQSNKINFDKNEKLINNGNNKLKLMNEM